MPQNHVPAHTNRLVHETSPYLLQHAHNPVDWWPWCEAALDKARREDKPILLSIGYSACHWCHVMERESFEDEAVARVMNELFVCIKVDREERPDLDKIYQLAHQMLMQRPGGWPLNMFLTPEDHTPFFGGTYFPKTPRHGLPGFVDVLRRVAAFYRERRAELAAQNAQVREAFRHLAPAPAAALAADEGIFRQAEEQLSRRFDRRHGGFGDAPKFPQAASLEFLLDHWARGTRRGEDRGRALAMLRASLHAMAAGGLYDQLGGGFFRYSVDAQWTIPHFEKMLYDNGPLQWLYADAWRATGEAAFRRVAEGIGDWVLREMQAPQGGYYATLDADAEGEEGGFYVWTEEQLRQAAGEAAWPVVAARFGLDGDPNFEGRWHLQVRRDLDQVARQTHLPLAEVKTRLGEATARLFATREARARPGRDEKILTAWNGLMIKGMARAGRVFGRADFLDSAQRALDFLRDHQWANGRLRAAWKDGRGRFDAYLDDYVFLADGVLELLAARWRADDLAFAVALMDTVLARFTDPSGGFFFTADDHERLLHRPKPTADDATPSGNAVAARVLVRLGHLLGRGDYLDAAEATLRALYPEMTRYPEAFGAGLLALAEWLDPPELVILRGAAPAWDDWRARLARGYAPGRLGLAVPDDADPLPQALAARSPRGGASAYLCRGNRCLPPLDDYDAFDAALAEREAPPPG